MMMSSTTDVSFTEISNDNLEHNHDIRNIKDKKTIATFQKSFYTFK